MIKTVKFIFVFIFLFSIIFVYAISNINLYNIRKTVKTQEEYLLIPSGRYIKTLSLGEEELFGDYILSRALTYYGKHYFERGYSYKNLYDFFKGVSDIDNFNKQAYMMGARLLSDREPHKGNRILRKGMGFLPDSWKLPELAGFIYYHNIRDKYLAAKYYEIASKKSSHPPFVPSLSSKFYAEGGDLENAIKVLYNFYSTTKDKRLKSSFKHDIENLSTELALRKRWKRGRVVKVVDGDSMFIRTAEGKDVEVRIIGINAFELHGKNEKKVVFGWIGKEFAYYNLMNKTIHYTIGGDRYDRYGRMLIYLWYGNNKLYNYEIVVRGFAKAFLKYDFNKIIKTKIKEAEKIAKINRRGLWGFDIIPPIKNRSHISDAVGDLAKIEFKVYNVYWGRKNIYINSSYDYRHNFKIVVPRWAENKFYPPLSSLRNRRIEVIGFVTEYRGVPEIRVYEKMQIKVLR
jgi:micrococcal nuclease